MRRIIVLSLLCAALMPFAASAGSKASARKAPEVVTFEGELTYLQQKTAKKIAEAIRSGKLERIQQFSQGSEDASTIRTFWSGVSTLSSLKFRARPIDDGFLLADAERGMSACGVVKRGERFLVENCTFNDGN